MKDTPRVLKMKVGGEASPSEDAARTVQLLQRCTSPKQGAGSSSNNNSRGTLRLDANQAWTMEEALQFSAALTAAAAGRRHCNSGKYVEEPLRDPRSLEKFWELSGRRVPYALDESLRMGRGVFTDEELVQLKGCAAFVLKVSVVGGLSRTAKLCRLARRLGAKAVLSSAFESGVGLAHASILASCFATQGVCSYGTTLTC
ncbi:unnamed protein product [Hapterophycus canaliculatus]